MFEIKYFTIQQTEYDVFCKLYLPTEIEPLSVVVGVHGFGGSKKSAANDALAERLTEQGSALLCFDFPAHGQSNAADEMLRVDNCIRDLLAVCDWAGSQFPDAPLSIFATSFGGYITLLALDKIKQLPEHLVLRTPAVRMTKLFKDRYLKEKFTEYEENGSIICGYDRKVRVPYSFYQDLERNDASCVKLPMPTLIIRAGRDELVDPEDIDAFCEGNSEVQLMDVPTASHRFRRPWELEQLLDAALGFL